MRTLYPVLMILALGTAAIMWSMSGVGLVIQGDDPAGGIESDKELNESAQELEDEKEDQQSGDGGFFSTSNQGDDSFIGAVIAGANQLADLATSAILLPIELQRLGLPTWLAMPLGLGGQAIAFIGFVQFVTGRRYE